MRKPSRKNRGEVILLQAKDCTSFKDQEAIGEVAPFLLKQVGTNVHFFRITNHAASKTDEESPLIEFDYRTKSWRAGRFVGSMEFEFNKKRYRLEITPRFGHYSLFRMMGVVFNVRSMPALTDIQRGQSQADFFRQFIAYLWVHKLAGCNRYGVPTHRHEQTHVGTSIKGKLAIRPSILPMYLANQLVSKQLEKQTDPTVARVVWQAYHRLRKEYYLDKSSFPDSATDALQHFGRVADLGRMVTESDYRRIKLRVMYQSWRPLLDLSWDIIRNRNQHQQSTSDMLGHALFFDMAEIWEAYLRKLLTRALATEGWAPVPEKWFSYADSFFRRELIPDIVLERAGKLLIFDAKYKGMSWTKQDVDRSDFFQLHTYIHYFQQVKEVVGGGLLYPFEKLPNERISASSSSLFGLGKTSTNIFIDGIELPQGEADVISQNLDTLSALYEAREKAFIARTKQMFEPN